MTTRPLQARDLAALHARCFETAWSKDAFVTLCAQPHTEVLWPDQQPKAAFILFRWVADEAELIMLCVDPEHRRRGLAQSLLAGMETRLLSENVREIHLEVRIDNTAAVALYEHAGFSTCGKRENYYRTETGRIDALLMSKNL